MIQEDPRFEITAPVTMGLVCFRLKGSNHDNEVLNKLINDEGKIHITPSKVRNIVFFSIRFKNMPEKDKCYKINFDLGVGYLLPTCGGLLKIH